MRPWGFAASAADAAGWMFGRWLDVVFMQRALGRGDATAPGL
jgi:phosphinothricin acetyltransferase